MIVIGIIVAVVVTARRLRARGVDPVVASEVAYWAVPFGIVGARLYHVVTSPDAYFGEDGDLVAVFEVWNGGLAIWGAVAGGALGAWLACRRMDVPFGLFADAVAPGLALSQAIGRWGNWFNQELYGRATDLPWAVRIDPAHQMIPGVATYHPTFLYESLWNLIVAGLLLLVDRRWRLGRGRLFFLYVALYTIGRLWIEALRIDTAEKVLGLRINIWVSIAVFVLALVALAFVRRPVDRNVGWSPSTGPGRSGADRGEGAGAADSATTGATEAAGGEKTAAGAGGASGTTDASGTAGTSGTAGAAGTVDSAGTVDATGTGGVAGTVGPDGAGGSRIDNVTGTGPATAAAPGEQVIEPAGPAPQAPAPQASAPQISAPGAVPAAEGAAGTPAKDPAASAGHDVR